MAHSHHHEEPHTGEDLTKQYALLEKLLAHWADHNNEHNKEYEKWSSAMKAAGKTDISSEIDKAVDAVNQANTALGAALDLVKKDIAAQAPAEKKPEAQTAAAQTK